MIFGEFWGLMVLFKALGMMLCLCVSSRLSQPIQVADGSLYPKECQMGAVAGLDLIHNQESLLKSLHHRMII